MQQAKVSMLFTDNRVKILAASMLQYIELEVIDLRFSMDTSPLFWNRTDEYRNEINEIQYFSRN